MTHWVGQNWQIVDGPEHPDDPFAPQSPVAIGVTFGMGLLDEPVAATGALNTAVAALRNELARPVETGPGTTGVPEVVAEVGLDTTTIMVRGSRGTASAAWRRFPDLFDPEVVTDDVVPMRADAPVWPADLLARTGPSAANLAWLRLAAPDVHSQARVLLTRLHPAAGDVPAVFFTTEETLAGLAFPVSHTPLPCRTGPDTRYVLPSEPAPGNARGRLAGDPQLLASTLVPRSASGLAAATLLRARMESAAAVAGVDAKIDGQLNGTGDGLCLLLTTESALDGPDRERLLTEFAKAPDLVPDVWVDQAVAAASELPGDLERDRRVLGLGPDPGATRPAVGQALRMVSRSLHLNLPTAPPASPAAAPDSAPSPLDDFPELFPFVTAEKGRRFGTGLPKGNKGVPSGSTTALTFGPSTLTAQVGHGAASTTLTLATDHIVAVVEDAAGTLSAVDDRQMSIAFHPGLFRRRRRLLATLAERLRGVPRLRYDSGADPAAVKRAVSRGKRIVLGLYAVIAAFAVFLTTMIVLQNSPTARHPSAELRSPGRSPQPTAPGARRGEPSPSPTASASPP